MDNAEQMAQPYIRRYNFRLPADPATAREYYDKCKRVLPGFMNAEDAQRRANALAYIALYEGRYGVPGAEVANAEAEIGDTGSSNTGADKTKDEETTLAPHETGVTVMKSKELKSKKATTTRTENHMEAYSVGDEADDITTEHMSGIAGYNFGDKLASADNIQADEAARFERELARRMSIRSIWDEAQDSLITQRSMLDWARGTGRPSTINQCAKKMTATLDRLLQLAESLDGFANMGVAEEWLKMARKLRFLQHVATHATKPVESMLDDYDGSSTPETSKDTSDNAIEWDRAWSKMALASRTLLLEWNKSQERMTRASIAFRNTVVQILKVLAVIQNGGEVRPEK